MPIALFAALAGSLAIHLAGLFGTDVELFGDGPEPQPLQAEIRPLPVVPVLAETPLVSQPPASKPATTKPAKAVKAPTRARAKRHRLPRPPCLRRKVSPKAVRVAALKAHPKLPLNCRRPQQSAHHSSYSSSHRPKPFFRPVASSVSLFSRSRLACRWGVPSIAGHSLRTAAIG